MEYVFLIAGIYLTLMAFIMTPKNVLSAFVLNGAMGLIGVMLLILSINELGVL